MSAPVDIVIVLGEHGSVAHLADRGRPVPRKAWCGELLRGGVTYEFGPGSDMGEAPGDCAKCAAMAKAGKR